MEPYKIDTAAQTEDANPSLALEKGQSSGIFHEALLRLRYKGALLSAVAERYGREPWYASAFLHDAGHVIVRCYGSAPVTGDLTPVMGHSVSFVVVAERPPAERPEVRAADAAAARELALSTRALEVGVPKNDVDLRRVVLDDDPPRTRALVVAQADLAAGRAVIRFLLGPKGVGKTAGAVWAMMRAEGSGAYVSAFRVAMTPQNAFPANADAWARWTTVSTLVLDDVGFEREELARTISELLLLRYDSGLATIATSNLTVTEVGDRYLGGEVGDRLRDRLAFAQGGALGKRFTGIVPWEKLEGDSLRSLSVREALYSQHAKGKVTR